MDKIRLLFAFPGQDPTEEIRFCWHGDADVCNLEIEGLPPVAVNGVLTDCGYDDQGTICIFRCEVKGLAPDTVYRYRVTSDDLATEWNSFRTGKAELPITVGIFSDVHMMPEEPEKIARCDELLEIVRQNAGEPDLNIFCGDVVKRGAFYTQWELFGHPEFVRNYTLANVAGNHDYYLTDKVRRDASRFNAICNNPDNGASEVPTSYWFIDGGVLFAVLDPIVEECASATDVQSDLDNQYKWLEGVLEANSGRADYIVVLQHYPHFVADEGGSVGWGGYDRWRGLFDRFGVDMAISGDYHCYVCSKPLFDDKPVDPGKGTVYVTIPQIATTYYESAFTDEGPEWLDILDGNMATTGVCALRADGEKLVFTAYEGDGREFHRVEIPKRNRE